MTAKLFLHIGLHKTGTTFLQREVFPFWPEVHYFRGGSLFAILDELIDSPHSKFLVSRESLSGMPLSNNGLSWIEGFAAAVERLAKLVPDAGIIIAFRRQRELLLSLYKQYLHEGGTEAIEGFLGINGSEPVINPDDLYFRPRIEILEAAFSTKPFIFLQEELLDGCSDVFGSLADFLGTPTPAVGVSQPRHNVGVGHYQARLLRVLNKPTRSRFNPEGFLPLNNKWFKRARLDPRSLCQLRLRWISSRPLQLSDAAAAHIDNRYADDWNYVLGRVKDR